jgi:hypothetical protein
MKTFAPLGMTLSMRRTGRASGSVEAASTSIASPTSITEFFRIVKPAFTLLTPALKK